MGYKTEGEWEPDWANRAKHIQHKPDWVDKIPHELWELGEVFFPIPRGKKGWTYPHHMDEYRYPPDSEKLNAYLESGWNYGVACDNDLIVIDIDEKEYIDVIVDKLPKSLYQWSGSGEGIHIFYMSEGFDTRKTLTLMRYDHTAENPEKSEEIHIGEIKADSNGYVVGPGSVHPSGNKYGPIKGDSIEEVDKEYILDALDQFLNKDRSISGSRTKRPPSHRGSYGDRSIDDLHEFYKIDADSVIPWLEPGKRIAHPIHGSSTGTNFMKNEDRSTFTCWRCQCGSGDGCGISPQQMLAMFALEDSLGDRACETIKNRWHSDSTLHYYGWREAARRGLIDTDEIPFTVVKGFMVKSGVIDEGEPLPVYNNAREEIRYQIQAYKRMNGR